MPDTIDAHLPEPGAGADRLLSLLRSNEIDPDGLFAYVPGAVRP